ncbi:hypothetical protein KBD33_05275, partial [Candidatus Gracilibacteria bacterium]|nr:hypothetical protein [Candidatus Gracilibacteria bacterium]
YPVFVSTDSFDSSLVLQGVTDGESYRNKSPGMSFSYDALDRIISQRDARGVTEKVYSPGKETIKNALGNITEARYDAYGNLTTFIEKMGSRDILTKYSCDALGRPVSLIDTYNNSRSWNYDGLGRLKLATDLHTSWDTTYGVRQYEYDTLGRVKKYTNAKNEQVSYTYDALSRITRESYPTSSSGSFIRDYTYDLGTRSLGTLSRVVDPNSTVNYGYDPLGRKTTETRIIGKKTYTLSYGYNSASVLTDISYPDGGKTKYTYKRGFIEGVRYTDSTGNFTQIISDISYAPNSTMRSIRYGNGVVKNTERDVNNNYRLTQATATASDGTKLLDTNYSYDAISNIVGITENGIDPLKKTISYTYDPLDRLSNANYAYSLAGYGRDQAKNFIYNYDDIGNIMSSSEVGSYSYAGTNFANPHAVTLAGDTNYSYDSAGNTTLRTTGNASLNFSYSPYGEMLTSVKNGDITNYAYDSTRRRISKSTLGHTEHHVIDGYEVEYESGALVPVSSLMGIVSNSEVTSTGVIILGTTKTGTTSTGVIITNSGFTLTGTTSTGILSATGSTLLQEALSGSIEQTDTISATSSGVTNSGVIPSGTTIPIMTYSGIVTSPNGIVSSGITTSGAISSSGTINSGPISTGTFMVSSGSSQSTGLSVNENSTVITYSGVISTGSALGSGSYIVVAGYTATEQTGAISIGLTTTLTHIMLGDEKIASFQSQTDDTPKNSNDSKLIFHISDHLNSSSLDLSSTGLILQVTDYQPFGKSITYQVTSERVKGTKGGYKNKYLFANKQLDDETDLQYFEKRYYDNKIGRFTTEDPVIWEVSLTKRTGQYFIDPQQWNSYSYVRNNPINMVDPSGELVDYSRMFSDERPNGTDMTYYQATNFTVQDADDHYTSMNGMPIGVDFSEINTFFILPESFTEINRYIKSGEDGSFLIDDKKTFTMPLGKDYEIFGDLTFRTLGQLNIKDGRWTYKGVYRSFDDTYDFEVTGEDWGDPLRLIRNYATMTKSTILGKGRNYDIQIRGEKQLRDSGDIPVLSKIRKFIKKETNKTNKEKGN